jgi:hypothetical protein
VKAEDVRLGMSVQVRRGPKEPNLRDRIGIVKRRFWNNIYSPFEVRFVDEWSEALWPSEFEKHGASTTTTSETG